MSAVLRYLLFCVFFHCVKCALYEDTFDGQEIKIREIDPERRPLCLLDPENPLDAHFLLIMRKYLRQDVEGIVKQPGGELRKIKRYPTAEDLENQGLWSWTVPHAGYSPTNVETNTLYTELDKELKTQPWCEPAIGTPRNGANGKEYIVDPLVFRPDLDPSIPRISFEYPVGFDNVLKIGSQERVPHPLGRTGVDDKGLLGNWIGYLAADLYMIMVSIDDDGVPEFDDEGVLVFKFLLSNRSDGGGHASPGGIVDRTRETPFDASAREFAEEIQRIPTTEDIDDLKKEIEQLTVEVSQLQGGNADKKVKEDTLKIKKVELAAAKKATKVKFIKELMDDMASDKDSEGLLNWLWCLYKGLAKDRRDADFGHMETIVFVYDVTLSKKITPEMIKRSEEVTEKPTFIKITVEWLAKNATFAMHGEFIEMIRKYIIPGRSNALRDILPGVGEGLATAAKRAIQKVVADGMVAIASLRSVQASNCTKSLKYRAERLGKSIAVKVDAAVKMFVQLRRTVINARKERGKGKPQPNAKFDQEALTAGKLAFHIVKEIKNILAETLELTLPNPPETENTLIQEIEAVMARIVVANQQIQYYMHAGDHENRILLSLAQSLYNQFIEAKEVLKTLQSRGGQEVRTPNVEEKASAELMEAKKVLSTAENIIRAWRGL